MNNWIIATLRDNKKVTPKIYQLDFDLPKSFIYQSGQYCDIRLTSEDGYIAERSYSLLSAFNEGDRYISFGVQLIEEGEVSPFLCNLKPGDQIEIKGPIGQHFIIDKDVDSPILLIGGGSGLVPLISIVKELFNTLIPTTQTVVLLASTKTREDLLYSKELLELSEKYKNFKLIQTLTGQRQNDWPGYNRRIDQNILEEILHEFTEKETVSTYVCGSTPFVESVSNNLINIGFKPERIRTERFGGA